MSIGSTRLACVALAMVAAAQPLMAATAADAATATGCERFAVEGLLPGMTDDQVRQIMRGGGSVSQVIDPDVGEISVRTYGALASSAYVVFDRKIGRGGDARVVRVRKGYPSTRANLDALEARMGSPTAGAAGLAPGLPGGPVVWIDPACDLAVTAFRRQESWWSGDVGTFLQVERLEEARKAGSPAAALLGAVAASEPPPLKLEITSQPPAPGSASGAPVPGDLTPAQRVHYVAPVYPQAAKLIKSTGSVRLSIVVREDGSVGDVRVLEASPSGQGFEAAATEAVKRWRYDPATRGGRPVASAQVVTLEFR